MLGRHPGRKSLTRRHFNLKQRLEIFQGDNRLLRVRRSPLQSFKQLACSSHRYLATKQIRPTRHQLITWG
ncbi:hypothetical protein SynMITS9220_01913 [Synechococcus sp. MIT S9220]|nr:hypothetical protein SynMITS9220_01913 [Synechococcus sp. MIT S9220]